MRLTEEDVLEAIKDIYPHTKRGVTMAMLCDDLQSDYMEIQPPLIQLRIKGLIAHKKGGNGWEPKDKMPWTPHQPQGFA